MNPFASFLVALCVLAGIASGYWLGPFAPILFFILAALISMSLKMANVWEKYGVLRLGKLQGVKGVGLFFIVPVIDCVIAVIAGRIQTTAFNAEQAFTKDTVPVNVDAIIFWHVEDAEKAALAVTNYREAIDRVAQTSLREMIGSPMLAALLSDRKDADSSSRTRSSSRRHPGASPSAQSRLATSRFPWRCKMRCPARPRPSGRSRLA